MIRAAKVTNNKAEEFLEGSANLNIFSSTLEAQTPGREPQQARYTWIWWCFDELRSIKALSVRPRGCHVASPFQQLVISLPSQTDLLEPSVMLLLSSSGKGNQDLLAAARPGGIYCQITPYFDGLCYIRGRISSFYPSYWNPHRIVPLLPIHTLEGYDSVICCFWALETPSHNYTREPPTLRTTPQNHTPTPAPAGTTSRNHILKPHKITSQNNTFNSHPFLKILQATTSFVNTSSIFINSAKLL